jgi:hypothetical protein
MVPQYCEEEFGGHAPGDSLSAAEDSAPATRDTAKGDALDRVKATSAAEFKQQLAALGFAYVPQTHGFLDLRRDKRKRFKRLIGVRDDHGRLMRRETIASLLASRLP